MDDRYRIPPDWQYHTDIQFAATEKPPFMWHRPERLLQIVNERIPKELQETISIGIVDTGYTDHEFLPKPVDVLNGTNRGGQDDVTARNPHGEHVFGIMGGKGGVGLLPHARYFIWKGLGDDGSGSTTWLNAGLRWCADKGCQYVNGSYGGPSGGQEDILAIKYGYTKSMRLYHFAAGNSGYSGKGSTEGYPAKHGLGGNNGSYDADGSRSSFSSGGPGVQVLGAGGKVVSTVPGSSVWGVMSGTSMGSPDVCVKTAAIDLYRTSLGLEPLIGPDAWKDFYKRLFEAKLIKDGGSPGRDNYYGWGQLMTEAIIEYFEEPSWL